MLADRRDGAVHERRAVVVGHDLDALGEGPLDLLDPVLDGRHHDAGVGAFELEREPGHDLALAVLGRRAEADGGAERDLGHVAERDRRAAARGDDRLAEVVHRLHEAVGADRQLLGAGLDGGRARVPGRLGRRVEHLAEREPVAREPVGVDEHLVLLEVPADGVDLGEARHAQELASDDPVLDRAELHRRVAARRVAERVAEHLAQARRDRPELRRLGAGRELVFDAPQLLQDELAGEVGVDAVLEDDGDDGDALAGERAELDEVGERLQGQLDGDAHEPLDFERAEGRGLRQDLDLVVGDVGDGVDRELGGGVEAGGDEADGGEQDEHSLAERERDDAIEHGGTENRGGRGPASRTATHGRASARGGREVGHVSNRRGGPHGSALYATEADDLRSRTDLSLCADGPRRGGRGPAPTARPRAARPRRTRTRRARPPGGRRRPGRSRSA